MADIIAIDGFSGTGKGTTAKSVAKKLGFLYLDTGAMYRAVTLLAMRNGLLEASDEEKVQLIKDNIISFRSNEETQSVHTFINNEDVERLIRTPDVAFNINNVSSRPAVRIKMKELQQKIGSTQNIVAEGRDMCDIVFPQAALKVFMRCDPKIRAQRRLHQLKQLGKEVDLETILQEITFRDEKDYLGPNAVNKIPTKNVYTLDTSTMSIEGQVDQVIARYNETKTNDQ